VFVAPGVALAASHVIEDYWKQFDDVDGWRIAKNATFPIQAIQYLPHHDRFVTWHVFLGSHRDTLDVCLLQLTPEEGQYPAGTCGPTRPWTCDRLRQARVCKLSEIRRLM